VSSSSCKCNWNSYLFIHNKSWNRLQPKRAEDLVYVYTNLKPLAEEKEDKKKWYIDNVDSKELEDSNFSLKEDVKVLGDSDLDGWDDRNFRVQDLDGETNCSLLASSGDHVWDPEDEYTFRDDGDDYIADLPSIATYVNGDGVFNNYNILRKSSTVEDVEDVVMPNFKVYALFSTKAPFMLPKLI
jgi:hypothetical protein